MKYNQPLDKPDDPNAVFIDGNPQLGIEGSIIPAAQVEYTQREIVNCIFKNGFVPNNGDQAQMTRAVQQDVINYGVDFGTVNKMSVTLDPAPITYSVGLKIFILVKFNNTSGVTLNVNGLGDVPVLTPLLEELGKDNIVTNGIALVYHDGTRFQLLFQAKAAGGPSGPQGVTGKDGLTGANGATGAKGDKGDKGEKGEQGVAGTASPTSLVLTAGAIGSYTVVQMSVTPPALIGGGGTSPVPAGFVQLGGVGTLSQTPPINSAGFWRLMGSWYSSTFNNETSWYGLYQRYA